MNDDGIERAGIQIAQIARVKALAAFDRTVETLLARVLTMEIKLDFRKIRDYNAITSRRCWLLESTG